VSLVLARVDQRLLHGQVAVGWVPVLDADRIWIADDATASDDFAREVVGSAAPPGATVEVFSIPEAAARLAGAVPGRTLLLVRSPGDLLRLIEAGASIALANVGGLHWREGARRFLDYVYVTPEDLDALRALAARGVRLVARDLPGNPAVDLVAALADGSLEFDHLSSRRS
jgi:mannose/fructose/N-acetylgalactosamine-specific phosphotransferase system component IIB